MGRNPIIAKLSVFWMLLLLPVTIVCGVKSLFVRPKHSPRRRLGSVILYAKFEGGISNMLCRKLLELVVVNPSPPFPLARILRIRDSKLIHASKQHAAGMLVLTSQVVLRQWIISSFLANGLQLLLQNFGELHNLMMPWGVRHIEVGRIRLAAERNSLHFHERAVSKGNQACIASNFIRIPTLYHGESSNGSLSFVFQARQGGFEPVPGITEERSINGFQAFWCRCIHTHIQLSNGDQIINRLRMLTIRHQKRRNLPVMQLLQQSINLGIHNRLPHQTQRTMPHFVRLRPSIHLYPRYTPRFLNHTHVRIDRLLHDHVGFVRLPSPFPPHGILVMTPTEHAFVGAGQGGGGFHALVGGDAVMGVFVTSAAAAELVLCPAA
mmetsp:Transcript_30162/g.51347  ORF Transcript_30162/g.51347 Transcript_30162/m.51347 type:complete len:380 (-) Transcript_30162:277-1416(-)